MPRRPLLVQPGKVGFERAAPNAEDVRPLTAKHLSGEAATIAGAAHDLLDRRAFFAHRKDDGVGFLAAQIPIILELLGRGEQRGMIVVAPIAARIWRIDLRTASRKARLAFSIRCQRSATWMASGSAFCVASA
jgi:hypothetical protein